MYVCMYVCMYAAKYYMTQPYIPKSWVEVTMLPKEAAKRSAKAKAETPGAIIRIFSDYNGFRV